jgi:hypothetical protein
MKVCSDENRLRLSNLGAILAGSCMTGCFCQFKVFMKPNFVLNFVVLFLRSVVMTIQLRQNKNALFLLNLVDLHTTQLY